MSPSHRHVSLLCAEFGLVPWRGAALFMARLLSAGAFHCDDSVPCKDELNKAKVCCCIQALSALGGLGSRLHALHNCKTKTSAFHTHARHILSALVISTCLKISLFVSCCCSQMGAGAQRHAVSGRVSGLEGSIIPIHYLDQTSLSSVFVTKIPSNSLSPAPVLSCRGRGLLPASAAFSMPCLNRHGFDSSCPSGRQGMLSSSGMGKEGVIGAMGPRLHFKASDCNHREQMRKRRSKLCTEHRPCSPSSVPTCSSCLPCSPSACPSSRRTKR